MVDFASKCVTYKCIERAIWCHFDFKTFSKKFGTLGQSFIEISPSILKFKKKRESPQGRWWADEVYISPIQPQA